ncbi:MAG: indole-3-glycerol phosphate synthase TrpC [Bacteroidales bacterium]|nr:indole-3-glycerol phosphate synthase TrpC [Clostridium sp.]MCM1203261.1 indole-3-glycerol phosphate synthase TrpC [Bacteroidales bacterium]
MAADILERIAADRRRQVEEEKQKLSPERMKEMALAKKGSLPDFVFENVLKKEGISFICEVKKASPSKGVIADDFPYVEIAEEYERAGADCLSVLTEPKYFLGCDRYLSEIRDAVKLPILRKDFTVDIYQLYQAKVIGANAVLLICSLLNPDFMAECIEICDELGLTALVEVHDETEMQMAVQAKARVVGVNNRNLRDFTVDIQNSTRLREMAPGEILFVAESGIKTRSDIEVLEKEQVNAVLVGETLMRAEDKKQKLEELKGNMNFD